MRRITIVPNLTKTMHPEKCVQKNYVPQQLAYFTNYCITIGKANTLQNRAPEHKLRAIHSNCRKRKSTWKECFSKFIILWHRNFSGLVDTLLAITLLQWHIHGHSKRTNIVVVMFCINSKLITLPHMSYIPCANKEHTVVAEDCSSSRGHALAVFRHAESQCGCVPARARGLRHFGGKRVLRSATRGCSVCLSRQGLTKLILLRMLCFCHFSCIRAIDRTKVASLIIRSLPHANILMSYSAPEGKGVSC